MPTLYTWPKSGTDYLPSNIRWQLRRNVARTQSAITAQPRRIGFTGDRWIVNLSIEGVHGDAFIEMREFALDISHGDAYVAVPDHSYTRRGLTTLIPKVNGASQTGSVLAVKNLTVSQSNALRRGDRFGLDQGQVVRVTADTDSDASGNASVPIDPPIRNSPTDDSHIEIDEPLVVCSVPEAFAQWFVEPGLFANLEFTLEEDFNDDAPVPVYT